MTTLSSKMLLSGDATAATYAQRLYVPPIAIVPNVTNRIAGTIRFLKIEGFSFLVALFELITPPNC